MYIVFICVGKNIICLGYIFICICENIICVGEYIMCIGKNIMCVGENIICVGCIFICVGGKLCTLYVANADISNKDNPTGGANTFLYDSPGLLCLDEILELHS